MEGEVISSGFVVMLIYKIRSPKVEAYLLDGTASIYRVENLTCIYSSATSQTDVQCSVISLMKS